MSFWKKKKPKRAIDTDQVFGMPAMKYASFVADMIDQTDPATRAHIAVAYQVFWNIVSAIDIYERQNDRSYSIEQAIEMAAESAAQATDEIGSRRTAWFMFAGLLSRLEKVARANPDIIPIATTTWTLLLTEYPRLKVLLPHNVVWKEEEKQWFDLSVTDNQMIQDGMNHHVPPIFSNHEIMKRFSTDLGIWHFPSNSRIGRVP